MKKALLYFLTAVLLGATMMILPQWIFWVSYATSTTTRQPPNTFGHAESFTDALSTSPKEWRFTQVPEQPSPEQTASYEDIGVFLASFVLALTLCFLYKRRAPYRAYRMSPF